VRGTIRERSRYRFQNAGDIAQDIVVPEAQNPIVMIGKPLVAHHVMPVVSMLPTIHLNDETGFTANKVDGVRADRFLPNKFMTAERTGS
jgi:hypothetical protein